MVGLARADARRGPRARRRRGPRDHPPRRPGGGRRPRVRQPRHAVRFVDPALRRPRGRAPWAATLTAEDCAAAASAGFLPAGVATGYSLALKHEDWQLKQQRSAWNNTEVDGLTELLSAARADARRSLAAKARQLSVGGELVVTESSLTTGERPCGEEKDMTAEALFVGTVLVPHPAPSARLGRTLTVLPLTPPTAPARRTPAGGSR